ncbi:MAG: hypothetical protein ACW98U_05495 [Candidatus Thorarchaeota archaeon]|jgi:hypothetical protein
MSKPMMFNGRLNKNESDIWLDLLQETSELGIRSLGMKFLQLPESISFVSSVDQKIIGGTTIYRDRTRLSMVLVSVAVKETFRESATYQIIKASLPFFKTVAIRDVDVLVSTDKSPDPLGFPLSLEVESWTYDAIERAGFTEVAKIGQYNFNIKQGNYSPLKWDSNPQKERAKELIWDQGKSSGLTTSLVWVARDFAATYGNLMTYTVNDKVAVVAGLWSAGDSLVVTLIVSDQDILDWSQVAEAIAAECTNLGRERIQFPLIGIGQTGLIEELKKRSISSSSRELSLMRKPL